MGSFYCLAFDGMLVGHHRAVEDAKSGEIIHVFAFSGPPTFGDDSEHRWDFYIKFVIGPATFEVRITERRKP